MKRTYQITRWCGWMYDDDVARNFKLENKEFTHKFRLLDDDGIVYGYGFSIDDSNFDPLDDYMYTYGVTEIQYKNKETGKYETL